MRKKLVVASLAAALVGVIGAPNASADHIDEYVAYSSGDQEVPRTAEDAWGWSVFRVYEDRIEYSTTVFDQDDIQAAHLHLAPRGVNGPVIVDLTDDIVNDTRIAGRIDRDEIDGLSIGQLVEAMADEEVYLNVHSSLYPNGAIRGQVVPSSQYDRQPLVSRSIDVAGVDHRPDADGGSDPSGTVSLSLRGNRLTVEVALSGLAPNLPHAQHLHGMLEMHDNHCPSIEADANGDGLISTVEGLPSYGGIQVSLTTTGDASPDSGLAVDRFPTADADGNLRFVRTFTVSDELVANFGSLHYVVHGIDVNGNGAYDFGAGVSSLDPSLPLEATVPAGCGV